MTNFIDEYNTYTVHRFRIAESKNIKLLALTPYYAQENG